MTPTGKPILFFKSDKEFEKWLAKNHSISDGIWVQFYKKGTGVVTLTYDKALDVALCYGWIDSQVNKYDDKSYIQKFTPRRSRSIWSKRNTEHVARLIKEGKMKPSGLLEMDKAKEDGRWEKAYESPVNAVAPDDFLKALSKNKKAQEFFKTLNKTNTFAITWRIQDAKKKETRERRIQKFIEMLERGEKFY